MKNQATSFVMCAIIGMLLLCACTSATPTTLPPFIISTPTKENPFGTLIASTPLPVPTSTPVDVPTIVPSKNSGRIAFFSSDQCTYEWNALVADADGSSTTKLIPQPFDNGGLMLSPDGSRIIMLLGQNPDIEYYVMDVGSAQKTKLPIDHDASFYSWSPDSRRIAFTSHSQIYVVNADGTELTNLTNDPADDSPLALSAWSPDGTSIAFTRSIGPDPFTRIDEVFMMRSDGSNQTRLTNRRNTNRVCSLHKYE
jgi:Tol biopolymer transport system component